MKRGQVGTIFALVLGVLFLVYVFALFSPLQAFTGGVAANSTLPTELQALIRLTPFFAGAVLIFAVVAALGKPNFGL